MYVYVQQYSSFYFVDTLPAVSKIAYSQVTSLLRQIYKKYKIIAFS